MSLFPTEDKVSPSADSVGGDDHNHALPVKFLGSLNSSKIHGHDIKIKVDGRRVAVIQMMDKEMWC